MLTEESVHPEESILSALSILRGGGDDSGVALGGFTDSGGVDAWCTQS